MPFLGVTMRIAKLSLVSFRCFGPKQATIGLNDLTALIGANGTGKSAVLGALVRLFGISQADRILVRSDFHLPHDKDWDDLTEAELRIEAKIVFPELAGKSADNDPVAASFRHMTITEHGKAPYCRVRLEGKWQRSNLPEGEIEQRLVWVTSPTGTKETDERTVSIQAHDRSRIHVH